MDKNHPEEYGIKISKKGFNVISDGKNPSIKKAMPYKVDHIHQLLALPYLQGARSQLKRYIEATEVLRNNPSSGTFLCLHEISVLFEDLNTVAKYIERCGNDDKMRELWRNIRNHIRHDFREEFDNEEGKNKVRRSTYLKLDPTLQVDIAFEKSSVRFGTRIIELSQVRRYLDWAEKIITRTLKKARQEGYITK